MRDAKLLLGLLMPASFAMLAGCSPDRGSNGVKPTSTTTQASSKSTSAPSSIESPKNEARGPVSPRCSSEGASGIRATASFARRADGGTDLVMRLSPPTDPVRYDATPKLQMFGAGRGQPSTREDGTGLEVRASVTFAERPFVTFIVPIHCGDEVGDVSASAKWEEEGTEPDRPLTVEVTPFQP